VRARSRVWRHSCSCPGELFVTSPAANEPLAPGADVTLTLADHGITLIRP